MVTIPETRWTFTGLGPRPEQEQRAKQTITIDGIDLQETQLSDGIIRTFLSGARQVYVLASSIAE